MVFRLWQTLLPSGRSDPQTPDKRYQLLNIALGKYELPHRKVRPAQKGGETLARVCFPIVCDCLKIRCADLRVACYRNEARHAVALYAMLGDDAPRAIWLSRLRTLICTEHNRSSRQGYVNCLLHGPIIEHCALGRD